jgi:hypothetical protein
MLQHPPACNWKFLTQVMSIERDATTITARARPIARSPAARVSRMPRHRLAGSFLDFGRKLLLASYRQKFAPKREQRPMTSRYLGSQR